MKKINLTYDKAFFSKEDIAGLSEDILPYVKHLHTVAVSSDIKETSISYKENESSINLPFDDNISDIIYNTVSEIGIDKLKYIIVVGIGGSNLGTKAIYDGVYGNLDPFLRDRMPKIIFLDTINKVFLNDLEKIIKRDIKTKEEIIVNIISKSGETTETIVNFEILNSLIENIIGSIDGRIVVTTNKDSKLYELAKEEGLRTLEIPQKVGGRYSVFSVVGLFPLAVVGIDIKSLLSGARTMRDICIDENFENNLAIISASLIYLHNKNGIKIHNSFFFNPELESLGKWYRQLMGESIGKKFDKNDKEVNSGITPIVSIGSTDLHSMAQLYFGGPKDKFTSFMYARYCGKEIKTPESFMFRGLVGGIENKDVSDIMSFILSGVKISYKKNKLPFLEINIDKIDENFLGQFMQFKMMEMMYLAHLLDINAFDQPSVEDYKNETRKILLK